MADFTVTGFIEGIRYTDNAAVVTVSERKLGFKKKDGTVVDDEMLFFQVAFKAYFKKYISSHFATGNLVKIKGVLFPYAKGKDGTIEEGCSIYGQTIDFAPYPTTAARSERKIMRESQQHSTGTPDLEGYLKEDF